MFETEVDGTPIPCDHPVRWYHHVAAWAHRRIEAMPFDQWQGFHARLPRWVCESYERVDFGFPCWQCESDRMREYGATIKSDADVLARMKGGIFAALDPAAGADPLAYDEADCPGGCGGQDCCGGHECGGGPDCNLA